MGRANSWLSSVHNTVMSSIWCCSYRITADSAPGTIPCWPVTLYPAQNALRGRLEAGDNCSPSAPDGLLEGGISTHLSAELHAVPSPPHPWWHLRMMLLLLMIIIVIIIIVVVVMVMVRMMTSLSHELLCDSSCSSILRARRCWHPRQFYSP